MSKLFCLTSIAPNGKQLTKYYDKISPAINAENKLAFKGVNVKLTEVQIEKRSK